eukprot:CAMPEP_0114686650 /NCGR_PEP_ID=MMETSP0191-20121206/61710_1 /TAXON_ID=126664 /ORGANISM="Sorites sp." /LENGTH=50 /DNA_ID=CAMNT_0001972385 /DNA_START=54 /DNA_END=202 /DNA_ORIENTATION=-
MAEHEAMKVDLAALHRLLPLGQEKSGIEARERIFKELVVRANCLVQLGQT